MTRNPAEGNPHHDHQHEGPASHRRARAARTTEERISTVPNASKPTHDDWPARTIRWPRVAEDVGCRGGPARNPAAQPKDARTSSGVHRENTSPSSDARGRSAPDPCAQSTARMPRSVGSTSDSQAGCANGMSDRDRRDGGRGGPLETPCHVRLQKAFPCKQNRYQGDQKRAAAAGGRCLARTLCDFEQNDRRNAPEAIRTDRQRALTRPDSEPVTEDPRAGRRRRQGRRWTPTKQRKPRSGHSSSDVASVADATLSVHRALEQHIPCLNGIRHSDLSIRDGDAGFQQRDDAQKSASVARARHTAIQGETEPRTIPLSPIASVMPQMTSTARRDASPLLHRAGGRNAADHRRKGLRPCRQRITTTLVKS